jgi:hypothetical protein
MGHDSLVFRVTRSVGCAVMSLLAAVVIGLSAPPTASATNVTDAYPPPPSPLTVLTTPFTFGMHVIETIAEGLANAVEMLATPAPIAVPAPRSGA